MARRSHCLQAVLFCVCSIVTATAIAADAVTILTPAQTIELSSATIDDGQLWVDADDLERITGFSLKAQGACCGAICVPINRDAAAGFVREKEGRLSLNLSKLAGLLDQPLAAEADRRVFSFGEIPVVRGSTLASGEAPDFALPDRQGKIVHLSDFRGKKVLLLTWASWCGCKLDLAGWQTLYAELKDKNFEIVAVAEDTAGEEAAGEWYDKARATYTTLIDRDHVVSSLYHMVNVPMGVWIDEQGRIVRPAEVAYSRDVKLMSIAVNGSDYVAGLRDWIAKGPDSTFAQAPGALRESLAARPPREALADAHFKLATHFKSTGDATLAARHWQKAQQLHPESWNYHRQQWSYEPKTALANWLAKVRGLGDKPYYAPLQLPAASDKSK